MKQRFKGIIIYVLVLCMVLFLFPYSFAEAKANNGSSAVKKISLNESNLYLELDQSYELKIKFTPQNSENGAKVLWTTSDSEIVTVQNGIVSAKGIGTAYVYANCDTSIAYCKITVIRYNPVRAVQNKNTTGYSGTDLEVITKASEVIEKYIEPGMTDEQKIKAIQNYLVEKCKYDHVNEINKTVTDSENGIIGTLVKNTAVRNGYAYTFKYFMDILGIEARITGLQAFMWNQVYLNGTWYVVNISLDTNAGNGAIWYQPSLSAALIVDNSKVSNWEDINFESVLLKYRDDDTYSGNETYARAYYETSGIRREDESEVNKAQEFTVTVDMNYTFTKQFGPVNGADHVITLNRNESFVYDEVPDMKSNTDIYVSSLNTKADGTGIAYPDKKVYNVNENLYLYCIWSVNIGQAKVTLTVGDGTFTSKWNEVKNCKDYQIRYSTAPSMKNSVMKNVTGQKAVISGLKKKTVYYVQVRAYIKDDNGTISYGRWSTKKQVKTS